MITRQAKAVFSAYRRDEFADPDGFVVQLGVVLEAYADNVILYVTSPQTGIQRRCKWPPTIAEVVEACDAESARQATLARYAAIPKPRSRTALLPDTRPGRRANVFIHADAPLYPRMLEQSKSRDANPADWWLDETRPGIWVSLGWVDGPAKGMWKKPIYPLPSDDDLRSQYGVATPEELDLAPESMDTIPEAAK